MQTCQIMNKLISANYWFGCDWVFYEVGYLGWCAGQLSLACAVVYLWNTGYLRVTRLRLYPGIQQMIGYGSGTFQVQSHHWTPRSFGSNRSRLEGQQIQCSSGIGDWGHYY